MTEAQYYEAPADGTAKKEAAFVQFRREGYLPGDFLTKGSDRFFFYMSGIQQDYLPLDPFWVEMTDLSSLWSTLRTLR